MKRYKYVILLAKRVSELNKHLSYDGKILSLVISPKKVEYSNGNKVILTFTGITTLSAVEKALNFIEMYKECKKNEHRVDIK